MNRLHFESHRQIPDDPLRTEIRKPPSFRLKEFSDESISYVSRSVRFSPGPRELEGLKPPKWQGPSLATGLETKTWARSEVLRIEPSNQIESTVRNRWR